MKPILKNQSGQAITEYIVMLSAVILFMILVVRGLRENKVAEKITTPITGDFVRAYQYGHPKALGPDDPQGPKNHPRIASPNKFRIFINPDVD